MCARRTAPGRRSSPGRSGSPAPVLRPASKPDGSGLAARSGSSGLPAPRPPSPASRRSPGRAVHWSPDSARPGALQQQGGRGGGSGAARRSPRAGRRLSPAREAGRRRGGREACGVAAAGGEARPRRRPSPRSFLPGYQNRGDLEMEALLEGMQNRGHDGGFLTSCEAELQELMKQIDIMVAHKKSEWEGQTHALETCLNIREQEVKTLRDQLEMKQKEVGALSQQIEENEKNKQEMTVEYKQELKKLQEELGRLKRSYEKLQKKHVRDFRGNTKNHREDRSEIERLTGKIEEFRQKSLDWEKQRLIYQQQVSSLEAQRKALAEQSEIIQAQLANRKQKLESMEISSQSEIQHLSSKLQRANDTICANELEIERLTIRINDLVGTNVNIVQEQRHKEEKLRESEKLLEVLREEKRELMAAIQSQESFDHTATMQKEKLQVKLKATDIQHTVETIRSLEDSQTTEKKYSSQGHEGLENVLSHLDFTHSSEELLQAEVTRLETSLDSVSSTCKQLSQELMEKYEELKKMEIYNNEYRAEIKKLKEQILQTDQSYSSVLEGMKMEISQLTRELHQRDITIASAKSSSSDMEKRLKEELQKAEVKALEHKEVVDQLESLKLENRQLSEMVMKLELDLHEKLSQIKRSEDSSRTEQNFPLYSNNFKAKENSVTDLQENYIEALNKLVFENQQLQKDLMDTKSKLEISTQMCQKNPDIIFKMTHSKAPEIENTEFKPTPGQHNRQDGIKTEHYTAGLHSLRGQAADSIDPLSRVLSTLSSHTSHDSSTISLPSTFQYKTQSLPSMLDINEADFSDTVSESLNDPDELSLCPVPVSPLGSIATKFLEEEELRSHHILERLDAHIEELKRESEKTVKQFTAPI